MPLIAVLKTSSFIPAATSNEDLRQQMSPYGQTAAYVHPLPDGTPEQWGEVLNLSLIAYNVFYALTALGIESANLADECNYDCPSWDFEFYGILPLALVYAPSRRQWYEEALHNVAPSERFSSSLWDSEAARFSLFRQGYRRPGMHPVVRAAMGSGYPDPNLDGEPFLEPVRVMLENGDWLFCMAWTWADK